MEYIVACRLLSFEFEDRQHWQQPTPKATSEMLLTAVTSVPET